MTTTTTTPLGGYALTSHKDEGGEETPRFTAYITKDGKKVIHVSNDGRGGSHHYRAVSDDWAAFRQHEAQFNAFATEWNKDSEYAGHEDGDDLVYRLIDVAVLNRKRAVFFELDTDDFFNEGTARTLGAGVTYEQTLSHLRAQYGDRARIWNKQRCEFLPVAEA